MKVKSRVDFLFRFFQSEPRWLLRIGGFILTGTSGRVATLIGVISEYENTVPLTAISVVVDNSYFYEKSNIYF
ncbi:hypothetical protein EVA_00516 [gut metagenome]|uniref:Uncharacterized protein n=1 Tax=gut metagenome TaxID=749906 RepID=J9GS67_9ZZZZ